MESTLFFLAELHYEVGLIGLDEFQERLQVAAWLSDAREPSISDPRGEVAIPDGVSDLTKSKVYEESGLVPSRQNKNSPFLEFVVLSQWYFTGSDADPYPSVPHGHLQSANRPWPKLNPYTGRVFKTKHKEDTKLRLSRAQMQCIWQDEAFRNHCRVHIMWYLQEYPAFNFTVPNPLRLPRKRKRP